MRLLITRLLAQDDGQDLIEYALLAGAIGLSSVAVWSLFGDALRSAYAAWDVGINGLWEPPNPQ
jgi:Flp pilus assembly pilin Flp